MRGNVKSIYCSSVYVEDDDGGDKDSDSPSCFC